MNKSLHDRKLFYRQCLLQGSPDSDSTFGAFGQKISFPTYFRRCFRCRDLTFYPTILNLEQPVETKRDETNETDFSIILQIQNDLALRLKECSRTCWNSGKIWLDRTKRLTSFLTNQSKFAIGRFFVQNDKSKLVGIRRESFYIEEHWTTSSHYQVINWWLDWMKEFS